MTALVQCDTLTQYSDLAQCDTSAWHDALAQ